MQDQILRLTAATWSLKKARVLVTDQAVAIFTNPAGPPTKVLTLTAPPANRTFQTTEGPVRYQPVGSSCQWPLAKCRQTTAQLNLRWKHPE